jgi:hypothetical protein
MQHSTVRVGPLFGGLARFFHHSLYNVHPALTNLIPLSIFPKGFTGSEVSRQALSPGTIRPPDKERGLFVILLFDTFGIIPNIGSVTCKFRNK